jgi:hypothetical protein
VHTLVRPDGRRRPLGIPNPRAYLKLSRVLEANWELIEKHLEAADTSISRPTLREASERAVEPRYRFGDRPRLRPRLWRGRRFLLNTDVSQFYKSLYTHSVPWALYGKQYAKAHMKETDELDAALRESAWGQTSGVPVGPDSSFVAAEIVLTAVDVRLAGEIPKLRAFRYIDDYEFACSSQSEAEQALGVFEAALADFKRREVSN